MEIEKIVPGDGPPIEEVKKYIDKYKDELIVIKYGGNVFIDRNIFNNFISDLSILNKPVSYTHLTLPTIYSV